MVTSVSNRKRDSVFFVELLEKEEKKDYFCLEYHLKVNIYEKILYIIVGCRSDVDFGIVWQRF